MVPIVLNSQHFADNLIHWYERNKRDLPWRNTVDTYQIWLSEVILQQTRVNQGLPYFQKFLYHYPNVKALAEAPEKEVLRHWQGLGYYSRAKNLHACARMIIKDYNGKFPNCYKDLLKLSGVGKYTAAAIASFAYKEKVPVVDGNVYRVLSRLFGVEDDISSAKGQHNFFELAKTLIPKKKSDIYNQAIMEFGALHCTPSQPKCETCPFKSACFAYREGKQHFLPVKNKKLKIKNRFFHYFILHYKDKIGMNERQHKDIWQGLYDFYLVEEKQFKNPETIRGNETVEWIIKNGGIMLHESRAFKHILTHQHIHAKFFHVRMKDALLSNSQLKMKNTAYYSINEIMDLPKPILIDNYLKEEFF